MKIVAMFLIIEFSYVSTDNNTNDSAFSANIVD